MAGNTVGVDRELWKTGERQSRPVDFAVGMV
jgi:hypothetical protein